MIKKTNCEVCEEKLETVVDMNFRNHPYCIKCKKFR